MTIILKRDEQSITVNVDSYSSELPKTITAISKDLSALVGEQPHYFATPYDLVPETDLQYTAKLHNDVEIEIAPEPTE